MKDFYKILGLKEDASEEEIRERWIELTKQYHPDRSEDKTSYEKILEINEAYQVLKHSSTRVEYDLKRIYGQGEKESKRGSYFKKLGVPASILIMVMMIGIVYLKTSQNGINETGQTSPKTSITQLPNDLTTNRLNGTVTQKPLAASAQQTRPPKEAISGTRPKGHRNAVPQRPKGPAVPRSITVQTDPTDSKNLIQSMNQSPGDAVDPATPIMVTLQKGESPAQLPGPITQSPNDLTSHRPPHSTHPLYSKIALAQFKLPALLATEDEVKKFFKNYIKYYDRKDVKGILSLFSSKAIQNQKDGLEEIRKIYTDFFNEGQEIRCSFQDMRMEIYQNAVEVKARYEIEQIVKTSGEREVWRGPIRWILIKEDGKLKILSVDYKYGRTPSGKKEESNESS